MVSTTWANNFSSTASFSTISSLLTLFSKFFSSFLRSTCMLSVSDKYLALGEVYLPIRAAFPNYPTLRNISYCLSTSKDGTFTLYGVLFQRTYDAPWLSELLHRLQFCICVQIYILGFYLFTRRYWGNHCYFLFLRLLICLSSAGTLAYFRCHNWIKRLGSDSPIPELRRLSPFSDYFVWYCKLTLPRIRWENYFNHIQFFDAINRAHWNKHDSRSCRHLRSKIWWLTVLQFALRIAFRCVLHRYRSQDIHRWKFINIL